MGSKQALSNGNEPEELTDLLNAFELHNQCRIVITCALQTKKGYRDTQWNIEAWNLQVGLLDPKPSVLASVQIWSGDYRTLMGLFTRLLYALDFQLALNEFEKVPTQRA